jgi:large subunit ribosomal protein L4
MVEARLYAFDGASEPQVVALDEHIFGAEVNTDLLHRAVRTQLLTRRQGTSSTKTRGEVQGGGRKPWRQKGTGRARAGSRRSPLWVGGGIIFGPKPRSYEVKLPKKMRTHALISALSDRGLSGKVVLVDRMGMDEPKTKTALALLERLGTDSSTLVVVGVSEYNNAITKSFSNLPDTKCLRSAGLNVYDVIRHTWLVMTMEALEEVRERFQSWRN